MTKGHQSYDDSLQQRFCGAVAEDLQVLAMLQERELDKERIQMLWEHSYSALFGLKLESDEGKAAIGLLQQGLTDIPAALDQESMDILAAEYADIYLNNSFSASPYESVWIDEDGLVMQEPMFQIRESYKRHGLSVADWRTRSDDHLVHQLQFIAYLMEEGNKEKLREAATFMDEHILRWIGDFAARISKRCGTRFYAGLAQLTAVYLDEFRDILADMNGEPRPSAEEIEERMKPKLGMKVAPPAAFAPGATPSW